MQPTQRKQLSPNVIGTERTQQQRDKNADLQKQLHDKQNELEAAQEMVQLLRKREKNLTDRQKNRPVNSLDITVMEKSQ